VGKVAHWKDFKNHLFSLDGFLVWISKEFIQENHMRKRMVVGKTNELETSHFKR